MQKRQQEMTGLLLIWPSLCRGEDPDGNLIREDVSKRTRLLLSRVGYGLILVAIASPAFPGIWKVVGLALSAGLYFGIGWVFIMKQE